MHLNLFPDPDDVRLTGDYSLARDYLGAFGPLAGFTLDSFDAALRPGHLPPPEQEDIIQSVLDAGDVHAVESDRRAA